MTAIFVNFFIILKVLELRKKSKQIFKFILHKVLYSSKKLVKIKKKQSYLTGDNSFKCIFLNISLLFKIYFMLKLFNSAFKNIKDLN